MDKSDDHAAFAHATRLMEFWRTSPAKNAPGRLVSNGNGGDSSFQVVGRVRTPS